MCLMSLSTPSAAGPCQCGQVAGQRHLYLKDQQDINTNDLKFEEPPQIPSASLKAEDANADQNDADKTQHAKGISEAEEDLLTTPTTRTRVLLALEPSGGQDLLGRGEAAPSPLQEELVLAPVREAGPSHPQVLHQPQVLHLVSDQEIIKLPWSKSTPSLVSSAWGGSPMCPHIGENQEGIKSLITHGAEFAASLTKLFIYKYTHKHTTYTRCTLLPTNPSAHSLDSAESPAPALPGSLFSLGLMQRMYEGSLDIRISIRLVRLFLN